MKTFLLSLVPLALLSSLAAALTLAAGYWLSENAAWFVCGLSLGLLALLAYRSRVVEQRQFYKTTVRLCEDEIDRQRRLVG